MYHHKTGYAPGEPVATHTRRRYRLLPSKYPNHNSPSPDSCLWIIHYGTAEPNDRVPSNVIPLDMRFQNTMNTRQYLQQQGQIVQKEFMLHDRANWPQIQFPRGPARGPPMYGASVGPSRIPQTMAYPTHHATAGPPPKRARTQANPSQNPAVVNALAVLDVDDDEDTSRGDLFDHTTPREVSMSRYKQNHEWMEEILSSPYSINQIIPTDLGLGVRGELSSLTDGVFDAPFDPEKDSSKYNYVGRLDADKADEFRKRAAERIAETNKEIEKMKAKHAKQLAKFQKGILVSQAEKELRVAVTDPTDTGPEYWRLEGRVDDDEDADEKAATETPSKVDDILAKVEASLGRHAVAVRELYRVQDGGYEEQAPLPPTPVNVPSPIGNISSHLSPGIINSMNGTPQSNSLIENTDMDGGNSAAGLLDQYHTGLSSNATPGSNFPTPQASALQLPNSGAGTPSHANSHSPQHTAQTQQSQLPADVNMSGVDEPPSTDATGSGDWVVVPPGGISPATGASEAQAPTAAQSSSVPAITSSTPQAPITSTYSPHPAVTSTDNTPLPDFAASPHDFSDLGDLDTAGDALASYGDLGDLGDMNVDVDDSAFGEAFHGVEARGDGEEGNGEGDGM
jgi:hypothetical protein